MVGGRCKVVVVSFRNRRHSAELRGSKLRRGLKHRRATTYRPTPTDSTATRESNFTAIGTSHSTNGHHVAPAQLTARHHIGNPLHKNIQHPVPPLYRRTSSKVQLLRFSQCRNKRAGRPDLAGRARRSNGKARTGLQCCCGLPNIVCAEAISLTQLIQLTVLSPFSPIPKRVMDGSEPGESVAAAVLSGAPIELQARTVRYILSALEIPIPFN